MLQFSRSSCLIGDEIMGEGNGDCSLIFTNWITHQSKSSISMEVYSTVTTTINHRRINLYTRVEKNRHTSQITLQQAYSQQDEGSAICVQRFNDSQTSAVRITYRSSLRSSSIQEPRYPSWRVITINKQLTKSLQLLIPLLSRQQHPPTTYNHKLQ